MGLEDLPAKTHDTYYNKYNRNLRRYWTTLLGVTQGFSYGFTLNPNRLGDRWGPPSFFHSFQFEGDMVMSALLELLHVISGLAIAHYSDLLRKEKRNESADAAEAFMLFGRSLVEAQLNSELPETLDPVIDGMSRMSTFHRVFGSVSLTLYILL